MPGPFLRSWVAARLSRGPPIAGPEEASELAANCIADAAMCGIFIDDLEEAAGGSVLNYIAKAIEGADGRTVDDMLKKVRPKDARRTKGPEATC